MDWDPPTVWWLATGALIAAELASGTFYLLMIALGTVAGAVAAHAGSTLAGQLVAAALVGGGAVVALLVRRRRQPAPSAANANRDVNLDVGSAVHVARWNADGTARVQYRGAGWDVRFVGAGTPEPGDHVVRAVDGNCLLLEAASH